MQAVPQEVSETWVLFGASNLAGVDWGMRDAVDAGPYVFHDVDLKRHERRCQL